jgi:hypothetical protein
LSSSVLDELHELRCSTFESARNSAQRKQQATAALSKQLEESAALVAKLIVDEAMHNGNDSPNLGLCLQR